MLFFRRAEGAPRSLAVLSAAFNPPTRAHLALARVGLGIAEEVICVLPRVFPHDKDYAAVRLEDRARMLEAAFGRAGSLRGP